MWLVPLSLSRGVSILFSCRSYLTRLCGGAIRLPTRAGDCSPRAAPVQHPRLRVERQVEAQQERPQTSAGTSTPRQSNRPPSTARTYYKVVACEDATSSRFVSIYDGRTHYAMDTTTSPAGGPGLLTCSPWFNASTLPSRSARLNAPRVILRLLGWNSQGQEPVVSPAHAGSTTKRLVSHVRPVAVLRTRQPASRARQWDLRISSRRRSPRSHLRIDLAPRRRHHGQSS